MKCPKCHTEMDKKELSGVEVDICSSCEGVFLDKGEVAAVSNKNLALQIDKAANAKNAGVRDHVPATCPKCDCLMIPLDIDDQSFKFDWCEKCDSLFFDQGELAAIASRERSE